MRHTTRRRFLTGSVSTVAGAMILPAIARAADASAQPHLQFPAEPRERIAIASYPFRDFVAGKKDSAISGKIELKDFAAHVAAKLNIRKIEPWSEHFRSLDGKHLQEIRAAMEKAGGMIVNIAVDGEHSPYAADQAERAKSVAFSKQWVDVAVAVGSPSMRTNMPKAADSEPDIQRAADSLRQVVDYASSRNILVNLENDNPESEDPNFIAKVIGTVKSPWLHALPDFANSLVAKPAWYAYNGLQQMFSQAYSICHVKALEVNDKGQEFDVDIAKSFGILANAHYKGYCSMEFDSPGDPYKGTAQLIETTIRYLS